MRNPRTEQVQICGSGICGNRKRKEESERLPSVFKPPEEMPSSEYWLTQSLGRIKPHQTQIPAQSLHVMSEGTMSEPISFIILSEVAATQHFRQQQLSPPLIHQCNHLLLRQSQSLMQYIHHGSCKLPQSKMLQFFLQGIPDY